ncbi:hypothetical protein Hanom_Chr16g01427141 [Helianthus anomalus]
MITVRFNGFRTLNRIHRRSSDRLRSDPELTSGTRATDALRVIVVQVGRVSVKTNRISVDFGLNRLIFDEFRFVSVCCLNFLNCLQ